MTTDELRNKIVVIRDSLLELNSEFIKAYDNGELIEGLNEDSLYLIHNQLSAIVKFFPYNNPIAKILENSK